MSGITFVAKDRSEKIPETKDLEMIVSDDDSEDGGIY
jgi:hypothetical protein